MSLRGTSNTTVAPSPGNGSNQDQIYFLFLHGMSNTTAVPSPSKGSNQNQIYFLFLFLILRLICLALLTIWNVQMRKRYYGEFPRIWNCSNEDRSLQSEKPLNLTWWLLCFSIFVDSETICELIFLNDYANEHLEKITRWFLLLNLFHAVTILFIGYIIISWYKPYIETIKDIIWYKEYSDYLLGEESYLLFPSFIIALFYGIHIFCVPLIMHIDQFLLMVSTILWIVFSGIIFIYSMLKLIRRLVTYCKRYS